MTSSPGIEQDIKNGVTVVVDRYFYSGCVYSAAKQNPLLDIQWARQPDTHLPRPDIVIFLDLSVEDTVQRGGFGEERYEKKAMQDRVRELFYTMQQGPDGEDFVKIDAGQSVDAVEREIFGAIQVMMQRVDSDDSPLRRVSP